MSDTSKAMHDYLDRLSGKLERKAMTQADIERVYEQAENRMEGIRDEKMVAEMEEYEETMDDQPWGIDPNINHEHDWRK